MYFCPPFYKFLLDMRSLAILFFYILHVKKKVLLLHFSHVNHTQKLKLPVIIIASRPRFQLRLNLSYLILNHLRIEQPRILFEIQVTNNNFQWRWLRWPH